MVGFKSLSKKGMAGALLLLALNGTTNAMDQAPREAVVQVSFHAAMEATDVHIIVKDAVTGQVVNRFYQAGNYKLPTGVYTFEVSGVTKVISKRDLRQRGTWDSRTGENLDGRVDRIQSPCEFFSDQPGQSTVVVDLSNVMMPLAISVFGDDNPKRNRHDSAGMHGRHMANQIRCQVVRAEGLQ